MDPSLISFGFNALMGLSSGWLEGQKIKAANTVKAAEVAGENLVRSANNELASKKGSLSRYNQSVNNQRIADSGGKQAEAALVNYRRAADNAVSGSFEEQIQFAEQAGAQAAQGAFSGLTGGVLDMVNSTTALRKSRIQQAGAERRKQGSYDASRQQGDIIRESLESMDNGSIVDSIDNSISVFTPQVRQGNWLSDISSGVNMKDVATLFSPKASHKSTFSFSENGMVP